MARVVDLHVMRSRPSLRVPVRGRSGRTSPPGARSPADTGSASGAGSASDTGSASGAYRRVLGTPVVTRTLVALLCTRLATPVLSLALILATAGKFGSYAVAGLVGAVHGASQALAGGLSGRVAGRYRPDRVLTGYLLAHALAYVVLLTLLWSPGPAPAAVAVGAGLLGATAPPFSAVVRSAWPRLVDAESLHAVYALDNLTNEMMFVAGPLLVTVAERWMTAELAIAVAGAALVTGGTALLLTPRPARETLLRPPQEPPSGTAVSRWKALAGPFSHRPTAVLLAVAGLATATYGALRLGVVADAGATGHEDRSGLLLVALSVGAVAGALWFGRRPRASRRRLLVRLCLAGAVTCLAAAWSPGLGALAALLALFGFVEGSRGSLEQVLVADHAPAALRTESFAWLNSMLWLGYAVGTAVAGPFVGATGGAAAFVLAAVVSAVAAAGALLLPRDRDPDGTA
ncbi:MFS transporter [Streptomyces sp. NPDC020807]|uniref:MFS transporter n=1 Tax=Streptomyces sp. NPDC020807 TaxID=3155119 RepID=UPI0033CE24D6